MFNFFSSPSLCTQALFLNYTVVIHNDKVDLAPFPTDRGGGGCSLSSNCEIRPATFHFPAAVKWLKDTDQPV